MAINKAAWIGGAAVLGLGYYFYRRRKNASAASRSAHSVPFEVLAQDLGFYPKSEPEPDNLLHFPSAAR